MKDHMTSIERDDLIRLNGNIRLCEDILERWGSRGNLSAEEAKYLKMARSLQEKVFRLIGERMGPRQLQLILRRAEYLLGSKRPEEYCINKTQLHQLCEQALLINCSPCRQGYNKKCPWRSLFKLAEVPACDAKATGKGRCIYEQCSQLPPLLCKELPCKIGQRVYVMRDGVRLESYVDAFAADKKGWMLHAAGSIDEWFDFRDWGTAIKEQEKQK